MPTNTSTNTLSELQKQKARLLQIMTSGVLEVEQPILGRTQYRNYDDMEKALRQLDALIVTLGGGSPDKTRRPIYPVATEGW